MISPLSSVRIDAQMSKFRRLHDRKKSLLAEAFLLLGDDFPSRDFFERHSVYFDVNSNGASVFYAQYSGERSPASATPVSFSADAKARNVGTIQASIASATPANAPTDFPPTRGLSACRLRSEEFFLATRVRMTCAHIRAATCIVKLKVDLCLWTVWIYENICDSVILHHATGSLFCERFSSQLKSRRIMSSSESSDPN